MSADGLVSMLRAAAPFVVLICLAGPARSEAINATQQPIQDQISEPADPLIVLVGDAVERTSRRYLQAEHHTPWQIMHGLLALRENYLIRSNGQTVRALDYISGGAKWQGEYWWEATPWGGKAHPYSVTYWFEGHVNQFLAIISMCNLPLDHPFTVKDGKVLTMADMVRHAQLCTTEREETTWTLWFLDNYLDQDAHWTTHDGQAWSMERLVRINTQAQVTTAPCGGTHQLFALALARNAYLKKHGRLTGAWLEADQKLQSYIAAAKSGQNPDGSFSSAMFKGRGMSNDFNERIKTSGHMLEWLMAALPERRLSEAWVRRGVEAVARDLINNANQPADCGPLYHALHAIILYRDRVAPRSAPSSPAPLELARTKPLPTPTPTPAAETRPAVESPSKTTAAALPQPLPQRAETQRPQSTTTDPKDTATAAVARPADPEIMTIQELLLPPPPPTREPVTAEETGVAAPLEIAPQPVGTDIDEARPRHAPRDDVEIELPPLPPR